MSVDIATLRLSTEVKGIDKLKKVYDILTELAAKKSDIKQLAETIKNMGLGGAPPGAPSAAAATTILPKKIIDDLDSMKKDVERMKIKQATYIPALEETKHTVATQIGQVLELIEARGGNLEDIVAPFAATQLGAHEWSEERFRSMARNIQLIMAIGKFIPELINMKASDVKRLGDAIKLGPKSPGTKGVSSIKGILERLGKGTGEAEALIRNRLTEIFRTKFEELKIPPEMIERIIGKEYKVYPVPHALRGPRRDVVDPIEFSEKALEAVEKAAKGDIVVARREANKFQFSGEQPHLTEDLMQRLLAIFSYINKEVAKSPTEYSKLDVRGFFSKEKQWAKGEYKPGSIDLVLRLLEGFEDKVLQGFNEVMRAISDMPEKELNEELIKRGVIAAVTKEIPIEVEFARQFMDQIQRYKSGQLTKMGYSDPSKVPEDIMNKLNKDLTQFVQLVNVIPGAHPSIVLDPKKSPVKDIATFALRSLGGLGLPRDVADLIEDVGELGKLLDKLYESSGTQEDQDKLILDAVTKGNIVGEETAKSIEARNKVIDALKIGLDKLIERRKEFEASIRSAQENIGDED